MSWGIEAFYGGPPAGQGCSPRHPRSLFEKSSAKTLDAQPSLALRLRGVLGDFWGSVFDVTLVVD